MMAVLEVERNNRENCYFERRHSEREIKKEAARQKQEQRKLIKKKEIEKENDSESER